MYQQTKFEGLANLCGLPQCYVSEDMEYGEFDKIWPKIQRVISETDDIRNQLRKQVLAVEKRLLITVQQAAHLINSKD